jgi:hypothetical protein
MRRNAMIALALIALILILVVGRIVGWAWPEMERLKADEAQARQSAIAIINQPVTHLPRTPEAEVFSPGWFHARAIEPDFNTADIRQSQEFPYANATYVTSDVNPDEMFMGKELEFNAMTKYFYADRSIPKKRLSESEMLEINLLYRTIGHDRQALAKPQAAIAGAFLMALLLVAAPFLFIRRSGEVGV